MEVEFRRTGERRYAVTIFRQGYPTIEMNPAPGYDPIMPHDLLHLVVEKEIGLRHGIFGQIAVGGNAGTFHPVPSPGENKRDAARLRRREVRRGDKLLRKGQDDSELSERAASICFNEWLSRSNDPGQKKLAAQSHYHSKPAADDLEILTAEVLKRICASLDDASQRWASLEIGESFSITWPDQAVSVTRGRKLENAI